MKWTSATALFLVVGALGVGAAVVVNREPKSPGEVLTEIRERMSEPLFDRNAALAQLERAIDDSRETADPATRTELLLTRAAIYRDLDVHQRAREDLERVAAAGANPEPNLLYEVAELLSLEGQPAEALQRTRSLTERFPDYGPGWVLRGELEERVAFAAVQEARSIADHRLSSSDVARADGLILDLAARHPRDPRRSELEFQLTDLFKGVRESALGQIMTLLNEPRTAFLRSRQAYARALELVATPRVVTNLARALTRAGQRDLATRLQFAARNFPSIANDPDATANLLDDLLRAERIPEARQLLLAWDWERGGTLEFYRSAGEVLYNANDLPALSRVALGLHKFGGETGSRWAPFFQAVGPARAPVQKGTLARRREVVPNLLAGLRKFATDDTFPEPFRGARNEAWFLMADLYKIAGATAGERTALQRALELDPDHSADAWARYAETMREVEKFQPWAEIELALTNAMNLDPSRTAALEPLWYEAGIQAIEKRGFTLPEVFDQVARRQTPLPVQEVGPAIQTRIAQEHLANHRLYQAIVAADEARSKFPRLVPPLDVQIAAQLADDRTPGTRVAGDIVERIESAGIDESVEGFLTQLPQGQLPGEYLVRAMRAAPVRFGKTAVARWYLERGDTERAGEALQGVDVSSSPVQLRLLRTRMLLEENDYAGALLELDRIPENAPRATAEAYALRLRALLGAGRQGPLQQTVREMVLSLPPEHPVLLTAIDTLLDGGEVELAYAIVQRLDQSASTRTPDFYRRRLLVDVMLAEQLGLAAVQESILRAEPYLSDGTPQIAGLLLAVDQREWVELRALAREIDSSSFAPDPLQTTVLELLGERLDPGRRSARAALERAPRNSIWALTAAAADTLVGGTIELPEWFGTRTADDLDILLRGADARSARDPRDVLSLLLVLDDPLWRPFVRRALESMARTTPSEIWMPWLEAQVALRSGDEAHALELIEHILSRAPQFGPAHDLAVGLAVERHRTEPLHPSVVAARTRRVQSMTGRLVGDDIEIQIAVAGEAARQGKYAFAVEQLRPVIAPGSKSEAEGRMMLSLFELRAGEPSFAAVYLQEATRQDLGPYREVALDALVEALDAALAAGGEQRGALTPEGALGIINEVSRRFPDDPFIALARLRLQNVSSGEQGERARGILRNLRSAAQGRSLDTLREGSVAAWVRYLAPIASDVASSLVELELTLEPGNIELLQLAGEVARLRGETTKARMNFETLLAIEPRAETGYALAELLIEEGAPAQDLQRVLDQAGRLEGGASARAAFLGSIHDLRRARPPLDQLVPRLRSRWNERKSSRNEVDPLELGLTYTDALIRRAQPEDLEALDEVLEELRPLVRDKLYENHYVRALAGLVKQLRASANAQ